MRLGRAIYFFFLLSPSFTWARPSTSVPEPWTEGARALGMGPGDFGVRPERWDTRFTLVPVETWLTHPLALPPVMEEWKRDLKETRSSGMMFRLAAEWLKGLDQYPPFDISPSLSPLSGNVAPQDVQQATASILKAIKQAQPLVEKAVESLPAADRQKLLTSWKAMATNHDDQEGVRQTARLIQDFDTAAMASAAMIISAAVDRALPVLTRAAAKKVSFRQQRWQLPEGIVLLSGSKGDDYKAKDLENVLLLVDLGGRNTYEGPVAAAGEKQIRVAIDLGEEVTLTEREQPSAGSGLLGVGLLYLPNPEGQKVITSGDFSQGAGFFGVGGLFLSGEASHLQAQNFSQGAGGFGIGVLADWSGRATSYNLAFGGQGLGFTDGLGLFLHRGDGGSIKGGLTYADPREDLAFSSMVQGVGFGPRALTGGGIGIHYVEGSRNRLEGSYFAQGAGYWHGLGACMIVGDENRLLSRRYAQGSGIHTALGSLTVSGNRNELFNWGVGPAYGWDFGIGHAAIIGNDNFLQADWGSIHGEVGGRGLALIQGNGTKILLPGMGTGTIVRNGPGYGLAVLSGTDLQISLSTRSVSSLDRFQYGVNHWGVIVSSGRVVLDPTLSRQTVSWPKTERAKAVEAERVQLQATLASADTREPAERIRSLLRVAAGFVLDNVAPGEARRKLQSLADSEIPLVVSNLSADDVDGFAYLRSLLAMYGPAIHDGLVQELPKAQGTRRMLLTALFGFDRVAAAFPHLEPITRDKDWRLRKASLGALGGLLSRETGRMTGRVEVLQTCVKLMKDKASVETWQKELNAGVIDKNLFELMPLLALARPTTPEERENLIRANGDPMFGLSREAWNLFIRTVRANPALYQPAFEKEIKEALALRPRVLALERRALGERDPEILVTALLALGQIGDESDTARLAPFLSHSALSVREAAASALSKRGHQAIPFINKALSLGSEKSRHAALKAIAQSSDPAAQKLLLQPLASPRREVRLAALSGIIQLFQPRPEVKAALLKRVQWMIQKDPDPVVRQNALLCEPLLL